MPRVIKHPDLRRSEFLDHALGLFLARGYDKTSLNEVIAAAGASKGAFYHHFSSKEALLEALAERMGRQAFAELQHAADEPNLDSLRRLNAFLAASRQLKLEMPDKSWRVFVALFRPENQVLYQRITAVWQALFQPLLTRVIALGAEEKVFNTSDPEGVAELLLGLTRLTYPIVIEAFGAPSHERRKAIIATIERRLRLYGVAIDRLLGLPDGSVMIVEPGFPDAFTGLLATLEGESHE